MSENGKFVVTHDAIIDGKEYTPRPGLCYEIAPGVIAKMRPATEGNVEAYDAIDEEYQALYEEQEPLVLKGGTEGFKASRLLEKRARAAAYVKCAVVLEVIEGGLDLEHETDRIIFPVAGRAVADFFSIKREILSAQMQSYQELLLAMKERLSSPSAQGGSAPSTSPQALSPLQREGLPSGPSESSSEAGAGSSVEESSVTVGAGSTAPSA